MYCYTYSIANFQGHYLATTEIESFAEKNVLGLSQNFGNA